MRSLRTLVPMLAAPCLTLGAQTSADTLRPARVSFGVGGGFAQSPPIFRWSGSDAIGYAGQALVETRTPVPFLRVRGEGLLANWGRDQHFGALTASVVAMPAARWRAVPYLLAGAGGYVVPDPSGFHRGWTLGAGVSVPVARWAFTMESRIHAFDIGADGVRRAGLDRVELGTQRWRTTYTPLLFGIRF